MVPWMSATPAFPGCTLARWDLLFANSAAQGGTLRALELLRVTDSALREGIASPGGPHQNQIVSAVALVLLNTSMGPQHASLARLGVLLASTAAPPALSE